MEKTTAFRAPGRVNIIGEHTDYNEGFVLPMAIGMEIRAEAVALPDRRVRLRSANFEGKAEFSLDDIRRDDEAAWSNYPRGVMKVLEEEGLRLSGAEISFHGDIPSGAGMSSSAALEVVTALAMTKLSGLALDRVEMALLCQKAENSFVGVNCGIMDQFISALGKRDHALLIDCRDLSHELVPLPLAGHCIIACNSNVKHSLVTSEYNRRREECAEGVRAIEARSGREIKSLRNVDMNLLQDCREAMDPIVYARCRHVVTENGRVLKAVAALRSGELQQFGRLMNDSHHSLSRDYAVSCPELDLLVDLALGVEGVRGSRMTGGGFGGCTITLVEEGAVERFQREVDREYLRRTGIKPDFYRCLPSEGAGQL